MSKMQMRMRSWACRVRTFLVARDVNSDLAERTGVRHDHDDTLGQLTVGATASEALTTQASGQASEVRRLRLALGERQLEQTVWTTRWMKLEIRGDDIAFVLFAFGVNDESLATTDDVVATVLTVLGLQFVVQRLASNFLELLRNATRVRRDVINQGAS
jgi:hypothetical protein